jgi:hypothetical protein
MIGPFAPSLFKMKLRFRIHTLNGKACLCPLKHQRYRKALSVGAAPDNSSGGACAVAHA